MPFNPFGVKGLKGKVCQLTPDLLTSLPLVDHKGEREVQKTGKIMKITVFLKIRWLPPPFILKYKQASWWLTQNIPYVSLIFWSPVSYFC